MRAIGLAVVLAALAVPAAAGASPELASLALRPGDVRGATVAQQGYLPKPSGTKEPVEAYDRVLDLPPGGDLEYVESGVAQFGSRTAAGASIDRFAADARTRGFAARLGRSLQVLGLRVLRVRHLGLGDQSLEVAVDYRRSKAAPRTDWSLSFVRVGAVVDRLQITGRRIDEAEVRRLAGLVAARTRKALA